MVQIDPAYLAFWGLVTFAVPLVLLFMPFLKGRVSESVLHIMLGLSAGILGGVTVVDILPEAFRAADEFSVPFIVVSGGIAIGLFLLFIVERHMLGVNREHGHVHMEDNREIRPMGTLAVSALAIHGVMDGFVIPIGYSAGGSVGLVITLAVALHQIPDSFSAASISLAAGYNRRKTALFVLITALDTPIGILVGVGFLLTTILGGGMWVVPFGLGLSAGTFIFVSGADLIPELQHRTSSAWVTVSVVLGFVFVSALSFWAGV